VPLPSPLDASGPTPRLTAPQDRSSWLFERAVIDETSNRTAALAALQNRAQSSAALMTSNRQV